MIPKVKYINYGIGNLIGDTIYLNKKLKGYPSLHARILDHELKHLRGEKLVDWKEKYDWDVFEFMFWHPSAWVQWLPIWVIGNKIIYSTKAFGICLFALVTILFLFMFTKWISN